MCLEKIAADLGFDCENKDVQGLETSIILINSSDIDRAGTTYDAASNTYTDLVLNTGASGFLLEGVKQLNSALSEVVVNDDSLNKWRHSLIGRIFNLNAATRAQIDALAGGANLVAVIEKKWKGANNASAFIVLGITTGLEISEGSENTNENDGSFVFTLASNDNSLEPNGAAILLETDYTTTKTAFTNKFAS